MTIVATFLPTPPEDDHNPYWSGKRPQTTSSVGLTAQRRDRPETRTAIVATIEHATAQAAPPAPT